MEMEIGNGNIKVAGLLAALIDLRVVAGLLFVCIRSSPSLQFTYPRSVWERVTLHWNRP